MTYADKYTGDRKDAGSLRKEIARLRKENDKLRSDLNDMKSRRELYELVVTTGGFPDETTCVERTFYAKKRDALNDLQFAWAKFLGGKYRESDYKPTNPTKGRVQASAVMGERYMSGTVTRINVV